jgi:hypothetical protein
VASTETVLIISNVNACRVAVRSSGWLDVFSNLIWKGNANDEKDDDKTQNDENVASRKEAAEVDKSNKPTFVAMDIQVPICDEPVSSQERKQADPKQKSDAHESPKYASWLWH